MTTQSLITKNIMSDIAFREAGHLKTNLKILAPFLLLFALIIVYSLQRTVSVLFEQDFIGDEIPEFFAWLWEVIEKESLASLFLALFGLVALSYKSKVLSFPRRFKEIAHYRS